MAIKVFENILSYHQSKVYKATIIFLYFGFWLFGLTSFTNSYRIYQLIVTLWCCKTVLTAYFAIANNVFADKHGINGVVSVILYAAHMLSHLIVLIESCGMCEQKVALFKHLSDIRNALKENTILRSAAIRLSRIVIGVSVLLACGHGIIIWSTLKNKSPTKLYCWGCLESYLVVQLKTLDIFIGLQQLNCYLIIIRSALNQMGERNLRRVFTKPLKFTNSKILYVVPMKAPDKDRQRLLLLKSTYNEVYAVFQAYNQNYGWSLLASTAGYFVNLLCNFYWMSSQGRDFLYILQSVSFVVMASILLCITCWYAEQCHYESRHIGCLVSKLVKPVGNKHYNDLVTEFAIQTLHQRFIITAKGFFNLNLSLLGRMVAAMVTYLVILIQFMFDEENKIGNSWISKSTLTSSNITFNI